jgi:peptidyl-prolyl cis-trans isomerase B (cyclophilin B)
MARTADPHSATAQFFINVKKNDFLNYTSKTEKGWGYTVFGKVIKGHDVVNKIKAVPTCSKDGFDDVPTEPLIIIKAEVVDS